MPSADAERAEVALWTGIGENAEAEVARARIAVNFIVFDIMLF
jgi:hypothetical protein